MGFDTSRSNVAYNDLVIVFMGHDSMLPVTVKQGEITQTKFGALKHNELVGHEFGAKFNCTKGWVYILQPTPELWTTTLPHRTQILYAPDIAMITFQLELKPGSVVCESGTGSGSLSHAIIRTVAPTGHLHTVEFNQDRYEKAGVEFENHGLSKNVTIYHRDVINDGFPVENAADAVFLDIPRPDEALPQAAKALKSSGGRICSFSPCIEQTQRFCALLRRPGSGFRDVETIEIVRKSHNVKRVNIPVADIGLGNPEVKQHVLSDKGPLNYAYETGDDLAIGHVIVRTNQEAGKPCKPPKRQKVENVDSQESNSEASGNVQQKKGPEDKGYTAPSATKFGYSFRTCIAPKEIYGHTGYLTFASYCPEVCLDLDWCQ
uniref:tRNA (adenine(58)-N(1))-methyltransferase catalytic subunit TRMT61A n=1 Tax=Phallusia mammillata TaxID=59560 RepID=A0A6F9D8Q1_9ASCI|nr:tRNA (adenine(58)-N(1))-methyltransferase catalytic subunit TRMT61A [Phallusia mammillata]